MSNDKVSREIVLHLVAMSSSYNVFIKRTRVLLVKSIFMIFDVPLFLESFFFNENNKPEKTNGYLLQKCSE